MDCCVCTDSATACCEDCGEGRCSDCTLGECGALTMLTAPTCAGGSPVNQFSGTCAEPARLCAEPPAAAGMDVASILEAISSSKYGGGGNVTININIGALHAPAHVPPAHAPLAHMSLAHTSLSHVSLAQFYHILPTAQGHPHTTRAAAAAVVVVSWHRAPSCFALCTPWFPDSSCPAPSQRTASGCHGSSCCCLGRASVSAALRDPPPTRRPAPTGVGL